MNRKAELNAYYYLLQWLIIAVAAGFAGCIIVHVFMTVYRFMTGFFLSIENVPVVVWPVAGALVVGLAVYRIEPRAKGEGLPSYILCLKDGKGRLSVSETFFKFVAAVITLGTFGNGGFLGPAGRVSAGVMSAVQRMFTRKLILKENRALFPICGLAAAFAALVHSPIGAGIFAVEIMQKSNMRYRHLFPAILSGCVSLLFSELFGMKPFFNVNAVTAAVGLEYTWTIVACGIAAGFIGRGFTFLYSLISGLFKRNNIQSNYGLTLRLVLGSFSACILTFLINPQLIGTSIDIFDAVLNGKSNILYGSLNSEIPLFLVIMLLITLKALANSLTVGSGMSAGFAGPAILIGLLTGVLFAEVFGIEAGTAGYFALLAAGFAGVFSATMNTPIASGVLVLELFGMSYSLSAGLGAVIGFQVNRHHTLYDMVFEEEDGEY